MMEGMRFDEEEDFITCMVPPPTTNNGVLSDAVRADHNKNREEETTTTATAAAANHDTGDNRCSSPFSATRTRGIIGGSILLVSLLVVVIAFVRSSSEFALSSSSKLVVPAVNDDYDGTKYGRYELVDIIDHDETSFTQGFEIVSYNKVQIMMNYYNHHHQKMKQRERENLNGNENDDDDDEKKNNEINNNEIMMMMTSNAENNNSTSTTIHTTNTITPTPSSPQLQVVASSSSSSSSSSYSNTENKYYIESEGQYGYSSLRIVELLTGKIVQEIPIDTQFFAEGCTYYLHDQYQYNATKPTSTTTTITVRIVQLTWQQGQGFVYELTIPINDGNDHDNGSDSDSTSTDTEMFSLERIGDFTFASSTTNGEASTTNGEGWGIIYYPITNQFIVSDGTEYIHFWELIDNENNANEETTTGTSNFNFHLIHKLRVTRSVRRTTNTANIEDGWKEQPVYKLNELEWDPYYNNGTTLLSNIWQSNNIVRIQLPSSLALVLEEEYDNDNDTINNNNTNNNYVAGRCLYQYDMSELVSLAFINYTNRIQGSVLNGIAFVYDDTNPNDNGNTAINTTTAPIPIRNEFWVTGKYWPKMFRVRFLH